MLYTEMIAVYCDNNAKHTFFVDKVWCITRGM